MKRIYHHYEKWEDYQKGMYNTDIKETEDMIKSGVNMLSNSDLFYSTCLFILDKWKYSVEVNLSNTGANRKAWLGQAACCITYGIPDLTTRKCWAQLTDNERNQANIAADKIIDIYEAKNTELHRGVEAKMLF